MAEVFFLYCHVDLRDLHSFPTRRSSDLCTQPIRSVYPAPPARRASPTANSTPASTDRKSTRLNSSHPSISYAVFCLKNKVARPVQRVLVAPGPGVPPLRERGRHRPPQDL